MLIFNTIRIKWPVDLPRWNTTFGRAFEIKKPLVLEVPATRFEPKYQEYQVR